MCHEEQLDERYRADNRAQAEHLGTKLAEIDAVIVPAAQTCRRSRSPRDPQGDVECLQGWSTTGTMGTGDRVRRRRPSRPTGEYATRRVVASMPAMRDAGAS